MHRYGPNLKQHIAKEYGNFKNGKSNSSHGQVGSLTSGFGSILIENFITEDSVQITEDSKNQREECKLQSLE